MKKVLAIMLALVLAFSMATVAFAADAKPENAKCGLCGSVLAEGELLAEHVCPTNADTIDLTVNDVLSMLLEYAKSVMEQWDGIESVITAALDFIANFNLEGVASIVDSVTAAFQGAGLDTSSGGLAELLEKLVNTVKQWFKDLYEQESETAVVTTEEVTEETETTVAEETAPNTGSVAGTSASIAVFAAVSVAAAAAYVTSKKRA